MREHFGDNRVLNSWTRLRATGEVADVDLPWQPLVAYLGFTSGPDR
jgi:hypothetical protein